MMNPDSKRPVTVEDLLRVKRAERPAPEFWAEFDRELRAKQLAALVEKRPWWREWPRALSGIARYHIPLGATAILAVTFLSIREYQPASADPSRERPVTSASDFALAAAPAESALRPVTVSPEAESVASTSSGTQPTSLSLSSEATSPGELARMIPMVGEDRSGERAGELRPSERSIAENLMAAQAVFGAASGFEVRAIPTRSAPQEPLAQMTAPAEARRSRFTTAFVSMNTTANAQTGARMARKLSDEQLYESIRRFGASGNSLSIKF